MINKSGEDQMKNSQIDFTSKLEIELVKKDVSLISKLCEKINGNVEDMKTIITDISRVVSLQEQKIKMQEEDSRELKKEFQDHKDEHEKDIKDLSVRIETVNNELTKKIDQTESIILTEIKTIKTELTENIGQINFWRYTVMGAIALAVFLISNFASKLFH